MARPSTRNLAALPDRAGLIQITKSAAMLDAILCPEWENRYFSFNSAWADSEQLASMRNGSGDGWKAHITEAGIVLFGLAHESPCYKPDQPMPGIYGGLPRVFASSLTEPAFETRNTSFCIWLCTGSDGWSIGDIALPELPDPDGSEGLLFVLDGNPETYTRWARTYYEREIDPGAVQAIYGGAALDEGLVASLNSDILVRDLSDDVKEIGYPW